MNEALDRRLAGVGLLFVVWGVFALGALAGVWPWAIDYPLIAWNVVAVCMVLEGRVAAVWFGLCGLMCIFIAVQAWSWKGGPVIAGAFVFACGLFGVGSFLHLRSDGARQTPR
jgi:hypothetical protein